MLKQAARSVALMFKYAKAPTVLCLCLQLAGAFEAPLGIYFTGRLVNAIGAYIEGTAEVAGAAAWAGGLIAVMTFGLVSSLLMSFVTIRMDEKLMRGFSQVVLGKFKRLEYSCFEDSDTLNTLERVGSEPHARIGELFFSSVQSASMLVSLIGTAVVFAQVSVWFSAVYAALLAPLLWFSFKSADENQKLWNTEMPNWRRRTYLSALLADKHGQYELKLFQAAAHVLKRWKEFADAFRREFVRLKISSVKFDVMSNIMVAGWAVFVILYLLSGLTSGSITLGVFVSCVASIGTIMSLSESFCNNVTHISANCIEMHHFTLFMSLPEAADTGGADIGESPSIVFDDVRFTYPKTDTPVLRGVSFEIRPGERVALVGENGAGKSTIVKLLCGLYKPDSGRILIGGQPIETLSREQLRETFSVVFQDYIGYWLTLRENVAFGDIGKLRDDAALRGALERGLWAEDMPLDANLGKLEDDGVDLSGGQWQRIAVARSLVRGSAFIILDEPTAALDPLAESRMYETFQSVLRRSGCIMISHRLASARLADKIVVLDGGTAAQTGTHDDLVVRDGLYREMFSAQAAWYVAVDS